MGVWRHGEMGSERAERKWEMGVGEKEGKGEIGHRELGQGR